MNKKMQVTNKYSLSLLSSHKHLTKAI